MTIDTKTFLVVENARRSADEFTLQDLCSPRAAGRTPLFVPKGQLYYWTAEWQRGEAEALADLGAGRFRMFSNGADAAAWLLADDNED